MDLVKVSAILEEIILQTQDREALINDAALILKEYDDEDDDASDWCDRFIAHAHRRAEFDDTIRKLLAAITEGEQA